MAQTIAGQAFAQATALPGSNVMISPVGGGFLQPRPLVSQDLYQQGSCASGQEFYNNAGTIGCQTPTFGTVTSVGQTFTGGLISVAGSPVTTSGTLALTVAGTSGGVPYFNGGSSWATSGALGAGQFVQGGGAGAAPSTFALGGDCTFATPNITCTKTGGTALGTFATQNYATPPAIGGTTPNGGAFTTLSASGAVSGTGFSNYLLSPPAIGTTTPSSGKFTTFEATGAGQFDTTLLVTGAVTINGAGTGLTVANNSTLGSSLLGGQGSFNPYAGPFPAYLYGIGGTGFYSANVLATNVLYNATGPLTVSSPQPYGMLNSAVAGSFTTGSNRPPCVNGFTAPSQVGFGLENGAVATCADADSQPSMASAAGTFTATTFTPTTPISQSASVFAAVGMWVRSSDVPPFNGQITSFAVNGSTQITSITVSNWYQEGQAGASGTPAGATLYLNPQDKIWGVLNAIYLNRFQVTGNVSSGSNVIASVSSTANVYDGGEFLQTATNLFPAKTWIVSHTANSITVNANATGTLVGETLNISAGTVMNRAVADEVDIFNNVSAQASATYVTGTATATSGSFVLTAVTNVASLYPGLQIRANVNLGQENQIRAVNIAGTTITMNRKATGSGAISYQARSRFDEGGAGTDCLTTAGFWGQTCYNQRGLVAYGYRSNGALVSSFLSQPDSLGISAPYGFLADQTYGSFSTAPFALFNPLGTATLWYVDQYGNAFSQGNGFVPSTIAGLPACSAGLRGFTKYIHDTVGAAAPTFHLIVAGGGATTVDSLASCNGTNWVYD